MRLLAPFLMLLMVSGCGYIPSAKYARGVLGSNVYATVEILSAEPENAVIIKDAFNEALISRFRVHLTKRKFADTVLNVKIQNPRFENLELDSNGYVVAKRVTVSLQIQRTRDKVTKSYTVSGAYDYDIDPNGVVSDAQRFTAIKLASYRALESLVTKLAVEGVK